MSQAGRMGLALHRDGGCMSKKILVATDGSAGSDRALDKAAEAAAREGAELLVINVAEDFCPVGLVEIDCDTVAAIIRKESEGILSAAMKRLEGKGVKARARIEHGSPASVIVEAAEREKADSIIIAAHGKHGVRKLALGSVSARVAEWAPCTVCVVK